MLNHYIKSDDTICAISTGNGAGAIAVIRVSGKDAFAICDQIFTPYKKNTSLENAPSHTALVGKIMREESMIDEVVCVVFRNPASFTGENTVEISCHGSLYVQQQIIQLLLQKGARQAQAGEFTQRAFMHGKMDLTQAEAIADLIAAETAAQHSIALNQMRGGFASELKNLRQELIDFVALIELELDFGEEDVEFADRSKLLYLIDAILLKINNLSSSFSLGNVIKQGVNVVLAGRPNAGKSTIFNQLLQEERAIVSDIAGTTRDTIEESINIDGILFRLTDTAGIREATDTIEKIGIERTMQKIQQAALLVYVLDSAQLSWPEVKEDLQNLMKEDLPVIVAVNKSDLPSIHRTAILDGLAQLTGIRILPTSFKQADDFLKLKKEMHQLAVEKMPAQQSVVVSNIRHYEALQKAAEALYKVIAGIQNGISNDFTAQDIREALYYLGSITGEVSNEEVLDSIFTRFCIGK